LEVSLGKKVYGTLISKIMTAKGTGGVIQAVELLLCQLQGPELNPSPIK
jgi:hypothetical protein